MPSSQNFKKGADNPLIAWGLRQKPIILGFFTLVACFLVVTLFDRTVTQQLTQWPAQERAFFAALARIGESDWMLIPTLSVWALAQLATRFPLGYSKRWGVRAIGSMSGFIFLSVAVPGLVVAVLKVAIGRARPILMDEVGIFSFTPFAGDWRFAGFPSGHATTAFALAWALYLLFGPRVMIVFFGAFLIALSRIVDGAHYLSDVLAGSAVGSIGAFWVQNQFQKRNLIFRIGKNGPKNGSSNRMLRPVLRYFGRFRQFGQKPAEEQ